MKCFVLFFFLSFSSIYFSLFSFIINLNSPLGGFYCNIYLKKSDISVCIHICAPEIRGDFFFTSLPVTGACEKKSQSEYNDDKHIK